jgi:competence protein ComEA
MRVRAKGAAAARVAAVLLMSIALSSAVAATAHAQTTRLAGVVNVNLATAEELELLPGIGPARAAAIIEHRKAHGPFASVDDLVQVSGIGEKALAQIKPHCVLKGKTTARLSGPGS